MRRDSDLWLFIVTAIRWCHDFSRATLCISCSRWKIIMFHEQWPLKMSFRKCVMSFNLRLTGQVKQWTLFNCWDIALIVLVALVHSRPTVVKLRSMWLEIYIYIFHYFTSKHIHNAYCRRDIWKQKCQITLINLVWFGYGFIHNSTVDIHIGIYLI